MAKETRNFKMHPKLLLDVIQRQAGSLSKAVLEGAMNADDAKAKKVKVTLDEDVLVVEDDGGGFKDRESITKFFEVFGQPHDESEGKRYGTFRMGRGQLFAYGENLWETGRFRMHVDIKRKGLDYDLDEVAEAVPGCRITVKLYESIGLVGVDRVRRDIEKWCKWMYPIRVYFNGEMVSNNPELGEWDEVREDAYVRLADGGDLAVYNLGVHVKDFSNYEFGTGGEVVSRRQLKVNFARNDIQSDCPVWRKLKPDLDQRATVRNAEKKSLGDGERQRFADQLRTGELPFEGAAHLKLFTAVTNRHFSAYDVMHPRHAKGSFRSYSVAAKGDRTGDTIMRCGLSFVFAKETLDRFKVKSVEQLLKWVKDNFAADYDRDACKLPVKDFKELSDTFKRSYTTIDEKDLTPHERLWLELIQSQGHRVVLDDVEVYGHSGRRLGIGAAEHAEGWTDGETFVILTRKFLANRNVDVRGITEVALLLFHEACHHTPDQESHDHDQAFYEEYHELTRYCLGPFVAGCIEHIPKLSDRLSTKLARTVDKARRATRSAAKLAAQADAGR